MSKINKIRDSLILILKYASQDPKYANDKLVSRNDNFGRMWEYNNGPLLVYDGHKTPAIRLLLGQKLCKLSQAKTMFGMETGEYFLRITPEGEQELKLLENEKG